MILHSRHLKTHYLRKIGWCWRLDLGPRFFQLQWSSCFHFPLAVPSSRHFQHFPSAYCVSWQPCGPWSFFSYLLQHLLLAVDIDVNDRAWKTRQSGSCLGCWSLACAQSSITQSAQVLLDTAPWLQLVQPDGITAVSSKLLEVKSIRSVPGAPSKGFQRSKAISINFLYSLGNKRIHFFCGKKVFLDTLAAVNIRFDKYPILETC